MSFFVSITFDLNYAEPSDYTTVKNKLEHLALKVMGVYPNSISDVNDRRTMP